MLSSIAKTIKKSLLDTLPAQVAAKFDIDESEFKEFLENYLSDQLAGGKTVRKSSARKPTPKGKNGKGRISGYILFCKENRSDVKSENSEMTSREITSELGRIWKSLEDSEKQEWNDRATKMNIDNGLEVKSVKEDKKEKSDKEDEEEKSDKEDEEEKNDKKSKNDKKEIIIKEIKVLRNKEIGCWQVSGTNYVVKSPKDKTITGIIKNHKISSLSKNEIKECKSNGWKLSIQEDSELED
jgi:hypothetical protein